MKTNLKVTALLALLSIGAFHGKASAFALGDFAFTSFNSREDGWALVALIDVPANSLLYFTDNEATNATTFNTGESYHSWNSGAALIPAGTVVRFSAIDSATLLDSSFGTLARATVTGSTN